MESGSSESSGLIKFLAWLEVNKKRVLIWTGAGVGVALLVVLVALVQERKEVRASHALSEIKMPLNPGDFPPGTAETYLKVARDYAGTQAAGRALLLHASLLFDQKNYAEAQARFEEFQRQYASSPWLPQAMFGVAACLDAQKKAGEAITKYEEIRRRFPTDAVVEEARLCLARLYEDENRLEEALQIYEELVQTQAGSGMAAEAGMRREDLLERYPQLAKTNLPSISTFPPLDASLTNLLPSAATNQASSNPPVQIELKTTPPPTPSPTPPPRAPLPTPGTPTNTAPAPPG